MIFSTLLLIFISSDSVYGNCQQLNECWRTEWMPEGREPPLFSKKTETEISNFCREFTDKQRICNFDELSRTCKTPEDRKKLDLISATNYQCNKSVNQVYREKFQCLVSERFHNDAMFCRERFMMKMEKYGPQCRVFRDIFACGTRVAAEHCGRDIAHFIQEYFIRMSASNLSHVNCAVREEPACPGVKTLVSCADPITKFFHRGVPVIDLQTESDLSDFCRKIHDVGNCVTDIKNRCKQSDDSFLNEKFGGIRKSSHYMCNEGKPEFLKHQKCLTGMKSSIKECYESFKSEMRGAKTETDECKVFKKGIKCSTDKVNEGCGAAAKQFLLKWFLEMASSHLSKIECPLEDISSEGISSAPKQLMTHSFMGLLQCAVFLLRL